MNAIENSLKHLELENRQVALGGCRLFDSLHEPPRAHELAQIEDLIRHGLIDTEARLGILRKRTRRRRDLVRRRVRRRRELGAMVEGHAALLLRRVELLRHRRGILLQFGDALAWRLLNGDIRRIMPLFVERTHELPDPIGLIGPLQLKRELQKTGKLWALENDITRCCGQGDLTVTRLDRPDATPLMIEVKTRAGEGLKEGAKLEILLITAHTNLQVDEETFRLVSDAVGGVPNISQMEMSRRAERQAEELLTSTELLAKLTQTGAYRLNNAPKHHWRIVAEILRKADIYGSAYEIPEQGLAYFSVSLGGVRKGVDALRKSRDQLMKHVEEWGSVRGASTVDIGSIPRMSAMVLPIPLWELPRELRAGLLTGELGFNTYLAEEALTQEFQARGVRFVEREGAWELHHNEDLYQLDQIEVRAVEMAMAMTALSLKSLVDSIVEGIANESTQRRRKA